ncbi:MAG: zf-HC2 domain-containing protein [Prevotella sp.]|nr:zf-HC2 domain-containing protein [Prevotella sp.]
MIVTCKVIEDLLPLYADGICSEDTKTIVEHHIAECAECRKKLEAMTSDTAEIPQSGDNGRSPENPFKKLRRHYTRLAVCTLLICAAVLIPSALLFTLHINEELDQGMSFSSLSAGRDMKKFGKMLKSGEYRAALDTVDLYYQDEYSPEELTSIKDMLAADMAEFYNEYPIKKMKAEPDDGKCGSGYLFLYLDGKNSRNTDGKPEQHLYFAFEENDSGSRTMKLGDGYSYWNLPGQEQDNKLDRELNAIFPQLALVPKSLAEDYFDRLENETDFYFTFWRFTTAEKLSCDNWNDDGRKISDEEVINCVYAQRLVELFEDYDFCGCRGGDVAYIQEEILDMRSYFSQHAVMTWSASGGEFTVEFDVPILCYGDFTHLKNVSYSDNAPNDFKQRFEEIFVNDEPVYDQYTTPKLNDGKFYLNGNTESCYYEFSGSNVILHAETDEQLRELYEAETANSDNDIVRDWDFDNWYDHLEKTNEAKPYEIVPTDVGVRVLTGVSYTDDGYRRFESTLPYINGDYIKRDGCKFIRVS